MKERIKDLEDIKAVFDKLGVRFFIVYGVLLGFYRDGNFLPGDDDIDIAVVDKLDLKTRKEIGWKLYDMGFQPQNIAFNVFGRMEPSEVGYNGDENTGIIVCERNFKFTIFFFNEEDCKEHGKEMVCIPKLGALRLISTPSKFFEKTDKIKIGKNKYLTPAPIKEYLSWAYFNNWKDKTDRRHSSTFFEQHMKNESVDVTGQNQVVLRK